MGDTTTEKLAAMVRDYGRACDNMGRSRQSNNFAVNGAAVNRAADLEIEIMKMLDNIAEQLTAHREAGRQLGMEQARREPLTEPQIAAAFDRAGIGHQRGETILGKPWWSTRGSKSCVELTRAIEAAHGITTPPAGDSDTQS